MITISEYTNYNGGWDDYLDNHSNASVYQKLAWKRVIEQTFHHTGYFLMANDNGNIRGVLPLMLMKSIFFGRYLVSLPFIDSSGLIADDPAIASMLLNRAIDLAQENQVDFLELRNQQKIDCDQLSTLTHKVNLVLPLQPDPNVLWKQVFHENIRNKVRKALKNQLHVESGISSQYINKFYAVFSRNMRDLGTPVYPLKFFLNMAQAFPDNMLIFLVGQADKVIGGKVVFLFKDTIYFIYHSSMREYAKLAPNNLLYWAAIEYACKAGYKYCNMGRSTIDSGSFIFKKQFGGEIRQLYWQYYLCKAQRLPNLNPANPKFSAAINTWKRLPLPVTRLLGPVIAKHIP